jgi:hypothetical protein
MPIGKIVFVVGHSNWGKSRTLKSLTDDSRYITKLKIRDIEFFIRRMSNDDKPKHDPEPTSFINFWERQNPAVRSHLIGTLCPRFDSPELIQHKILEQLQEKGYQLFFWVIRLGWNRPDTITPNEIGLLKGFGIVEEFDQEAEAHRRAVHLRAFISNRVCS